MVVLIGLDQSLKANIKFKPITPAKTSNIKTGKNKPKVSSKVVRLYFKICDKFNDET